MGDSGWCYFKVDDEQIDNEYTDALLNCMYNILNYGSWAGEFSANGEATYNYKTRTFEGIDYYSEDTDEILNISDSDFKIEIPKKLWFDTLHIEVECNYDETPNVDVRLIVKNGFITHKHSNICSNLAEILKDYFNNLFDEYNFINNDKFRYCNDSWILEKSEAIEENDMLVFKLNKINIHVDITDERDVVLELDNDLIKIIDKKLNIVEDESN